ncbi:DUF1214 domain-containing protein [Nocardia gipuzkoensis]
MSIDRGTAPAEITIPDLLETRLGALEFTDGAPSRETVQKVYDNLDLIRGVEVFLNAFQGASTWALRQGFRSIGAEDNTIVIFSELMDSQSLFLTANADTVYYVGIIDATARTLLFDARESEGVRYYPGSAWTNMLFPGGYTFETPPPLVTDEGIEPFPRGGARKLNLRTLFFYGYTGITLAMCMRLTGIGSQYLVAYKDSDGTYFDGGEHYTVTLPPDIPAARFWSITLYDNQTRSMLQTPQRYPRAGSQSYPTPSADADADGTTAIHIAPGKPAGVGDGNWIQSVTGKGYFVILRLYSPLASYFDKTWQPGEIHRR